MGEARDRYRLLGAAAGAVLMGVSVFLPWYGVSVTARGAALAQQAGEQAAAQYGNAQLQSLMGSLQSRFASIVGHEVDSLSAHQALKVIGVLLLVLAGLALLDALAPFARSAELPAGAGAALALLGAVAACCITYRIASPPAPAEPVLALSVREGAWLSLLGASTVLVCGLWPRGGPRRSGPDSRVESAWTGLSGWTPQA